MSMGYKPFLRKRLSDNQPMDPALNWHDQRRNGSAILSIDPTMGGLDRMAAEQNNFRSCTNLLNYGKRAYSINSAVHLLVLKGLSACIPRCVCFVESGCNSVCDSVNLISFSISARRIIAVKV